MMYVITMRVCNAFGLPQLLKYKTTTVKLEWKLFQWCCGSHPQPKPNIYVLSLHYTANQIQIHVRCVSLS